MAIREADKHHSPFNSATAFLVKNGKRFWMFNERGELLITKLSPKGGVQDVQSMTTILRLIVLNNEVAILVSMLIDKLKAIFDLGLKTRSCEARDGTRF